MRKVHSRADKVGDRKEHYYVWSMEDIVAQMLVWKKVAGTAFSMV